MKFILPALFFLLLTSCDLLHIEQKIYCAKANLEQCQARPDWCVTTGNKGFCRGTGCGQFCNNEKDPTKCVLRNETISKCQAAGILKNGMIIIDKEPEWKYKSLAPATKEFFGKKITQAALQTMKPEDRKRICDVFPGEPCDLVWDSTADNAVCRLIEDSCKECKVVTEAFACHSKNLCSGVICL